jgi:hypothetical protein
MSTSFTATDLFQLPPSAPSNWIVDGLLRTHRGRPSLFCGFPESGKSTLVTQLAIAVANGQPFLGRATVQGHVIVWKNEDSAQDVSEDLKRAGMTPASMLSVVIPSVGDENHRALRDELERHPDTVLVIIETLADFLNVEDISSNNDTRVAMQKFIDLIIKPYPGCSVVLLHHLNKSSVEADLSAKKILGGTVIAGATDAKIYLKRVSDEDPRRIISATIRRGRGIEPTYLEFDHETQIATLGNTVKAEAIAKKKATKEQKGLESDLHILQVIRENPGMPKWDIAKKVGGNALAFGKKVNELIEMNLVSATLGGEKGNAICLYPKIQESKQIGFEESTMQAA